MKVEVKERLGKYRVEFTFLGTFHSMSFNHKESAEEYKNEFENALTKHTNQRVIEELERFDKVHEKFDKECDACISPYQLKIRIKELKQESSNQHVKEELASERRRDKAGQDACYLDTLTSEQAKNYENSKLESND
jgi:hypothetical protein